MPTEIPDYVHPASLCEGQFCCYHNPSDHHMVDWPLHVRIDRVAWTPPDAHGEQRPVGVLTERICPHGCGHPDPDSLAWLLANGASDAEGIHGCCLCCRAGAYPTS